MQVLNTYLSQQALPGGPFVLGDKYSIAEVSAAPFIWRATFLLPQFRDIDALAEAKAMRLTRFLEWTQVSVASCLLQQKHLTSCTHHAHMINCNTKLVPIYASHMQSGNK